MLKVINPASGEIIKELKADTATTVVEKFNKAKIAQKDWAATPLNARIKAIRQFRERLEKDKTELAQILTSEVGKPLKQSINEVNGTLGRIDFFLDKVASALQGEAVFKDGSMDEVIHHEPLGVIANISAWNYPYFVGSNVFIPALLTGNVVLYKPSEFSSLTGLAITERLHQSGIPTDAFQILIGEGVIGAELLKQPINGVFFTGSYGTGKKIAETVAGRMIKIQLELGGKDPSYVCEDADVASAVDSLSDGAFYNTGQSCCSVERIYVHAKIYDTFVDKFASAVQGFKVGDPTSDDTYIGPLTREAQIQTLERQVQDAKAKGAKLLCGGERLKRKGYYFAPTVFSNVNHTMELMREESFGPIIGIQKVKDDQEALSLMNDTAYGLTAGVYTPDRERAQKILAQVNAGSVYWNCCDRVSPRLPWSGRGHSGIGTTLSTYGIQTFLQPKAWHLRG
ncbi:MAG: aldehyde dehydrogenase family protein [Bdellovibrionales bacterium]